MSEKNKNRESWMYEKYVESASDVLRRNEWMLKSDHHLKSFLSHILEKVFTIGQKHNQQQQQQENMLRETSIPITDLSLYPEIWSHVQARWEKGKCN